MIIHRKLAASAISRRPLSAIRLFAVTEREGGALKGKTARALLFFVVLAAIPFLVPALSAYRVAIPQSVYDLFQNRAVEVVTDHATTIQDVAGYESSGQKIHSVPGKIEDPSGRALDHFFESLLKTETIGGKTAISHYGDSPITNDGITSTVRRRLQLRFGDSGHGFILIAKPWGWYGHTGVTHEAGRGWQSDPMFISRGDHLYGLGGVSFTSSIAGATAIFGTAEDGEVGRSVSSFDIYYLKQPGGGDFDVEIADSHYTRVATAGDEVRSGFYRVNLEEGHHRMTIKTVGGGEVRLFGVALESGKPGVQYDSLGVNGAFIGLLANYIDAEHWAEQLRHRRPALVIIGYGANESQFESLPMDRYERDTKEAIRRIREAAPEVSIMFVGPMDRGMRGAGGAIVTRPMIPKLISYQRRIAAETGCAFFDTYTAMGGEGTVARWYSARPRLMGGDFTHPTAQGAEIVGTLIYEAIIEAHENYKDRMSAVSLRKRD